MQIFHHIVYIYLLFVSVAVQTNLVPPKKVQPGMLQSSLVHASVATMQNPMGCALPRLSGSSRPASMVASIEAVADGSAPFTMMKLKTVLAVFVVVVAYLVAGGLVFQALEQPFENNQKITITAEKAAFLQKHPCVSPDELKAIIKVRAANGRYSSLSSALDAVLYWGVSSTNLHFILICHHSGSTHTPQSARKIMLPCFAIASLNFTQG